MKDVVEAGNENIRGGGCAWFMMYGSSSSVHATDAEMLYTIWWCPALATAMKGSALHDWI
jgi:hypothetical protein